MSLQTQVTLLRAAISAYRDTLVELFQRPATSAVQADNTAALEGVSAEALVGEYLLGMPEHIADTDNPHVVTLDQIDSYSADYIDTTFEQKIPIGILPVSRYGQLGYLPPGVQGSYEAGTNLNVSEAQMQALCYEDDGTLVFIYNGTDGGSRGAFYGYVLNPVTETSSIRTILTGQRYRPGFVPEEYYVRTIYRGNNEALVGIIARISDDGDQKAFVALTNGTYDATQHVGAIIPTAVYDPASNQMLRSVEPVINGNYLYLIRTTAGIGQQNPASPVELEVRRIALSDIQAGSVSAIELLTNWLSITTKRNLSTTHPRLASVATSTLTTDDALFYLPTGLYGHDIFPSYCGGSPTLTRVDRVTGRMQVTLTGAVRLYPTADQSPTKNVCVSVILDPAARNSLLETPFRNGCTLSVVGGDFTFSNDNYVPKDNYTVFYGLRSRLLTADGWELALGSTLYTGGFMRYWRAKATDYTTNFGSFKLGSGGFSSQHERDIIPVGPTPVMNGIYNLRFFTDGKAACVSFGKGQNQVRVAYRDTGENPTYVYRSLSLGTLNGYSPKTDRKTFTELGTPLWVAEQPMTLEVDVVGTLRCGGNNLASDLLTAPLTINSNLSGSGIISLPPSLMPNTVATVLAQAGISGTPKLTRHQLIVPTLLSNAPVILVTSLIDAAGVQREVLTRCSVSARSGTILSLTPQALIAQWSGISVVDTNHPDTMYRWKYQSGVLETVDGWIYTVNSIHPYRVPGNDFANSYTFFLRKSDYGAEGLQRVEWPFYAPTPFMVVPGHGMGILHSYDFATKALFIPLATDKSSFLAWSSPPTSNWITLFSQKSAEGWAVYFTEETPVLLSGRPYLLDATVIDLRDISETPENSTFYIYVRLQDGVAQYHIAEAPLPESAGVLYIGQATTSDTEITSLTAEKATRLDLYRLSLEPRGSSMPISSGNPAQTGSIDPSW